MKLQQNDLRLKRMRVL